MQVMYGLRVVVRQRRSWGAEAGVSRAWGQYFRPRERSESVCGRLLSVVFSMEMRSRWSSAKGDRNACEYCSSPYMAEVLVPWRKQHRRMGFGTGSEGVYDVGCPSSMAVE